MTVRARVEDALLLAKAGRWDGALLSVLIATAATARRRFPDHKISDRVAFETFLREGWIARMGFNVEGGGSINFLVEGDYHTLEHILYKWFRCSLAHEAALPNLVIFDSSDSSEGWRIRSGADGEPFALSRGHLDLLMAAVIEAPENADDFPDAQTIMGGPPPTRESGPRTGPKWVSASKKHKKKGK